MIVFGALLIAAGVIAYATGAGDPSGGWWLLPAGLLAAGLGVVVAGTVARVRRRLAPLRAARQATRPGPGAGGPVRRLRVIPRMISASWRGQYPVLPRYQTLLWLVGLVYLVSPIDAIPELLPLIGVSDDIGVGAWLLTSLYAEAGNYLGQADSKDGDRAVEAE